MSKGFGKISPQKARNNRQQKPQVKVNFPLVSGLVQRIRSGELVHKQSTTWDWLESLTEEEEMRLASLCDSESSDDVAEVIVLAVRLRVMETGKNRGLTEEEIESLVQRLAVMSATRELIKAGLVEVKNFPKRLTDRNQKFGFRLTGGEL